MLHQTVLPLYVARAVLHLQQDRDQELHHVVRRPGVIQRQPQWNNPEVIEPQMNKKERIGVES